MIEKSFTLVPFEKNDVFSLNGKFKVTKNVLNCDLNISPNKRAIGSVDSKISTADRRLSSIYVPNDPENLRFTKKEGLWDSTCFEIFIKSGNHYIEWNFAPSGEWWVMDFSDYRKRIGSVEVGTLIPHKMEWAHREGLECHVSIPVKKEKFEIGISCVLEVGATKTHWALAHPKDKLDFHDSTCFQTI